MNGLQIFSSEQFGAVRIAEEDGKVLFCGADIAAALGYTNPRKALSDHCRCVTKCYVPHPQSPDKQITMSFISEGDVYRLIASSKLPRAQEFEVWVFDTVLPEIRKTGGYIAGEERMDDDQLMAQALIVASRKLEQRTAQLRAANAAIEEMAPKAAYYDAVAASDGDKSFRETAKMFGVPEKKFIRILIEKRYIYRDARGTLVPYADHMKRGQFTVREVVINGVETLRSASQTKITPVGRQAIWRMLAKEGEVSL